MKDAKTYLTVSMTIFSLVAVLQFVRMYLGWPVTIGGFEVPIWASAVVLVIASAMAVLAFQLLRKRSA